MCVVCAAAVQVMGDGCFVWSGILHGFSSLLQLQPTRELSSCHAMPPLINGLSAVPRLPAAAAAL